MTTFDIKKYENAKQLFNPDHYNVRNINGYNVIYRTEKLHEPSTSIMPYILYVTLEHFLEDKMFNLEHYELIRNNRKRLPIFNSVANNIHTSICCCCNSIDHNLYYLHEPAKIIFVVGSVCIYNYFVNHGITDDELKKKNLLKKLNPKNKDPDSLCSYCNAKTAFSSGCKQGFCSKECFELNKEYAHLLCSICNNKKLKEEHNLCYNCFMEKKNGIKTGTCLIKI